MCTHLVNTHLMVSFVRVYVYSDLRDQLTLLYIHMLIANSYDYNVILEVRCLYNACVRIIKSSDANNKPCPLDLGEAAPMS